MVFVFIEILFKMLLFKGGVLIYAEHCIYNIYMYIYYYNILMHINSSHVPMTVHPKRLNYLPKYSSVAMKKP